MKTTCIRSFAKINICLDIVGTREDGYHLLDMVMVPIELHDSIVLSELKKSENNMFSMDDFTHGVLDYNVVMQVLNAFSQKYNFNNKFSINIHKVVPMQAGLGGGSSNAAFTLDGVNKMLKINAPFEELVELTTPFGADIPFFLMCKPARCQGIGEKLTPINIKNNYYVLIVKPEDGCPTSEIYKISDSMNLRTGNVEKVIKALEEGDDETLAASIFNALEAPAASLVPDIFLIKEQMKNLGLKIVQMSGSGSAVFAMSTDKKLIKKAAKHFENRYKTIVTKVIK